MKKVLLGVLIGVIMCVGSFLIYNNIIKVDDKEEDNKQNEIENNILCKSSLNNGEFVYKVKKDNNIVIWSIEKDNIEVLKRIGNYSEIDDNDITITGITTKECNITKLNKILITSDEGYSYYYLSAELFGTYTGFGGVIAYSNKTGSYYKLFDLYINPLVKYQLRNSAVTVNNARIENGRVYDIIRQDSGFIMEYEYVFSNGSYTKNSTGEDYMPVGGIK